MITVASFNLGTIDADPSTGTTTPRRLRDGENRIAVAVTLANASSFEGSAVVQVSLAENGDSGWFTPTHPTNTLEALTTNGTYGDCFDSLSGLWMRVLVTRTAGSADVTVTTCLSEDE